MEDQIDPYYILVLALLSNGTWRVSLFLELQGPFCRQLSCTANRLQQQKRLNDLNRVFPLLHFVHLSSVIIFIDLLRHSWGSTPAQRDSAPPTAMEEATCC
ncbi:hypothetical protein Y032_0031g2320 [Ancylostoma ceylanicum]|uniref:Uncharacterized protein n=1 Tax=Ancylostoma ceylanicum TaxID=53326 RepID=A0A016URP9_9BILA|nr:hypothetical protein Y032_0031g2320 [Ancylostoma ceylanicum]